LPQKEKQDNDLTAKIDKAMASHQTDLFMLWLVHFFKRIMIRLKNNE
jgi:hypothetical protein